MRSDHRGLLGSKPINTARGTPWVWRTCGMLCLFARTRAAGEHTGLRQASMSRGVEARGSSVGAGGKRSKEDGPARGLDKEYGRWRLRARCRAEWSQV